MLTRRHLSAGALLAGLAAPALAQPPRRLRFVPQAAYSSPDPVWTTAIIVQTHAYMVWDMLYGVDLGLTPRPQMCAGHELSDDQLTWTFTLRGGLRFHDGEPVRAIDAVASIARWAQRNSFGQVLAGLTQEMAALDDLRLRIRLRGPFPHMLYALGSGSASLFIMPERLARTPATEPMPDFVGSGPFRFMRDEWVAGVRSVYGRFEGYVPRPEAPDYLAGGKVAHFDRVEWVVQPDPGTAATALQAGEVDWLDQPLFDLVPKLGATPGVTVRQLDPFGLIGIIALNHLHPPFDNPRLRQALLPAVDQREFVAAVLGDQAGYARLPVGYFNAGSPLASDAGMAALAGPRDLSLARRLVRESGYNGERVVLLDPADQAQQHAMAAVTAELFRSLDLNVDVQTVDWGTLLTRRSSTRPVNEGGWSAFNTRQTGLETVDPSSGQLRGNGAKAWYGWPTDPEMERLRQIWFNASDLAAEQGVARQVQEQAFRGVPYIPLGQWSQPTAFRSDLRDHVRGGNPLFWGVRRG